MERWKELLFQAIWVQLWCFGVYLLFRSFVAFFHIIIVISKIDTTVSKYVWKVVQIWRHWTKKIFTNRACVSIKQNVIHTLKMVYLIWMNLIKISQAIWSYVFLTFWFIPPHICMLRSSVNGPVLMCSWKHFIYWPDKNGIIFFLIFLFTYYKQQTVILGTKLNLLRIDWTRKFN